MVGTIIIFIVLIIWIAALYDRYLPKIDIVVQGNHYVVLLWYNQQHWNGDYLRTYIKLFKL